MRRQEVLHDYIGYGLRIMSKFIPEKGNLLLPALRFSHIVGRRLLPEWTIPCFYVCNELSSPRMDPWGQIVTHSYESDPDRQAGPSFVTKIRAAGFGIAFSVTLRPLCLSSLLWFFSCVALNSYSIRIQSIAQPRVRESAEPPALAGFHGG